jgi:hypothetical protein
MVPAPFSVPHTAMKEQTMLEKRKWPRFPCLERCDMHPRADSSPTRQSRVLNYCYNGLLLETDSPLDQGQYVKINVHGNGLDKMLTGIGKRVGRVRWCSRPDQSSDCFEMGIEMLGGVSEDTLS